MVLLLVASRTNEVLVTFATMLLAAFLVGLEPPSDEVVAVVQSGGVHRAQLPSRRRPTALGIEVLPQMPVVEEVEISV